MQLKLSGFTEKHTKEICNWKYEGEYSIYNYPNYSRAINEKWAITIKQKREKEFFSIVNECNELYGYVRFQTKEKEILVGIGLKPTLCGKGLGNVAMKLIIKECAYLYPFKDIILEVRKFNKRAINCYKKAGFIEVSRYNKETSIGPGEFIKMKFNQDGVN